MRDDPGLLLGWLGRSALWGGDAAAVERSAARIAAMGVHLPAVQLRRRSLSAGLAGLHGDAAEAVAGYRQVLDGWGRLGHTYEEAFTALDMASVLGPDLADVQRAAERAREIFGRMGARPFLERLEGLMSRVPGETDRRPTGIPATRASG